MIKITLEELKADTAKWVDKSTVEDVSVVDEHGEAVLTMSMVRITNDEQRILELETERDELAEQVEILTARVGGAEREAEARLEIATRLEAERDLARSIAIDMEARKDSWVQVCATLKDEILVLRHMDLIIQASNRAHVGPLHLARWAKLERAGLVAREGEVFTLTAKGKEVWRG